MPSLRGHMVFMSHFRDVLAGELPEVARRVEAEWPAALLGSQGPDGWFFVEGATRPDTHMLDKDRPETWPGWFDRWLEAHRSISPGRERPAVQAAFIAGYLSHLGMDVWAELYHDAQLPEALRSAARDEWYPAQLSDPTRVSAALRRLGEAPFPGERLVSEEEIRAAAARVPASFNPDAIVRVALGIVPSLGMDDPWESSRISPLREMPRTQEARAAWDAQRAAQSHATDAEYGALLAAASAFTLELLREWW